MYDNLHNNNSLKINTISIVCTKLYIQGKYVTSKCDINYVKTTI